MNEQGAIMQTPFWLVWNPNGDSPRCKHGCKEMAEQEANRLARKNPGQEFYVLEPVYQAVKSDIAIRRFTDYGVPF